MGKQSDNNHESEVHSTSEVHVETQSESYTSSSGDSADRVDELTADLKRVQAEFLNYKRRAEAEKGELVTFSKNRIVREFLAVRDSFDQEASHRPTTVDAVWAESIDSIRHQFDIVLKNLGATRFESVGHVFDPHLHEAIAMEEGEGKYEVVSEELQPGYRLGDTILRHAMVKVGRSDKPISNPPSSSQSEARDKAPSESPAEED